MFQGLSHADQHQVASVARTITLDTNERSLSSGFVGSHLLVMHTGRVKVSRFDANGNEQVIRVLGPGDFMGEAAFLTGSNPDHSLMALEPATMCVFGHQDLGRLVQQHPTIGLRMLQDVSNRLHTTEERLVAAVSREVSSRLAGYLLSLPVKHIDGAMTVTLPLAKRDIASLLDTTPESLSRQLRRLQDSQIIELVERDRVLLHDVDALMELSAN